MSSTPTPEAGSSYYLAGARDAQQRRSPRSTSRCRE
jgi:hypothetical protein